METAGPPLPIERALKNDLVTISVVYQQQYSNANENLKVNFLHQCDQIGTATAR